MSEWGGQRPATARANQTIKNREQLSASRGGGANDGQSSGAESLKGAGVLSAGGRSGPELSAGRRHSRHRAVASTTSAWDR